MADWYAYTYMTVRVVKPMRVHDVNFYAFVSGCKLCRPLDVAADIV